MEQKADLNNDIDIVDTGINMHTALKKCDSTVTSLAWNLLLLMPREVWFKYVELVLEAHKGSPGRGWVPAAKEARQVFKVFEQDYNSTHKWSQIEYSHWARCLYCTLELFSDSDWKGFVEYNG
jgi:hypothetical protein